MTLLIIIALLILMPFIIKLAVVYLAFLDWALRLKPIQLSLTLGKKTAQPAKKKQIGFPLNPVSEEAPVVSKKKEK